jgi:hypothetical protein
MSAISRIRWPRTALAAAALGLLTLGLPRPAVAGLIIETTAVVTDSAGVVVGTLQIGPTPGPAAFPSSVTITTPSGTNVGGVVITGPLGAAHTASDPGTVINNSPGALLNSVLDQLTNQVGATRIAHIVVSATGYTVPPPATLSENLAGRWLNAAGSSVAARWYENPTDQLATVTGTVGLADSTFNPNGSVQVGPQAGPANTPGSFFTATDNTLQAFAYSVSGLAAPSSATPYGMTLAFDLTLTPGADLQNSAQAALALAAPAPEPASVALALSGLSLLGGYGLFRRWRRA